MRRAQSTGLSALNRLAVPFDVVRGAVPKRPRALALQQRLKKLAQTLNGQQWRLLRRPIPQFVVAGQHRNRGPLMKPHRLRPICRSHNPFSPATALWHHFVVPYHGRQQRLSSSATGAAELHEAPNVEHDTSSPESTPSGGVGRQERAEEQHAQLKVQFTPNGQQAYKSKRLASIKKNIDRQADQSSRNVEHLMFMAQAAYDETKDYEGIVVQPLRSRSPVQEKALPWVSPEHRSKGKGLGRLAAEISRFHKFAKPDRFEAAARRHVIEQVRNDVRSLAPQYILEVFGSERTGVALATSDLDLRLMRPQDVDARPDAAKPPTKEERMRMLNDLTALHHKKFVRNKTYLLPMLRHARYPLIALQHRASGLDVQIVLSNDTSVSRNLMHKYMQEYPYLPELYSVVKTMFDVRGLSDVFRGGFGSYSVFMMVVASLKHHPGRRDDAAGALCQFLDFWATFDTVHKGISIEPAWLFDKSEELVMPERTKTKIQAGAQKPPPKYMLCLRDPAEETNDLGRKGACIKHVQATLAHLLHQLRSDIDKNTRHSLLGPLVGPTYSLNKERRAKLAAYGRQVLDELKVSIVQTAKSIREEEGREGQHAENGQEVTGATPGKDGWDGSRDAVTVSSENALG